MISRDFQESLLDSKLVQTVLPFPRSRVQMKEHPENFEFNMFISHQHEGGKDLAQAIKLQLQVCTGGQISVCSIFCFKR
jgi:hypothetical protein